MSEARRPRGRFSLYVIGLLLLLLIVVWVWKDMSVRAAGKRCEEQRAEWVAQQSELEQRMRQAAAEKAEEVLRLMAVPLGWAVRSEAIQDDYDEIEKYALRLVKEPLVRRVVLANPEGTIRLATDRKLQGEPASRFFGDLTGEGEITLRRDPSGDYQLLVPILGYTGRLGSLIVTIVGEQPATAGDAL